MDAISPSQSQQVPMAQLPTSTTPTFTVDRQSLLPLLPNTGSQRPTGRWAQLHGRGCGAWPGQGGAKQSKQKAQGSQKPPGTLISGTTILDSGFLSNMRVIRSFKSSAMSGLGTKEGSGASNRH